MQYSPMSMVLSVRKTTAKRLLTMMVILIASSLSLLGIAGCTSNRSEQPAEETTVLALPVLATSYPNPTVQQKEVADDDDAARTVIDNERGLYFGYPYDPGSRNWQHSNAWNNIGAFIGRRHMDQIARMQPQAIKGVHGRLQHFNAADANFAYFPYDAFKAFADAEVNAGRDPLFVTATYEGEQRPVYFSWSIHGDPDHYSQAVNVADERFARFFVEEYVQESLYVPGVQNQWIGLDNCAFLYNAYGVIDDDGTFVRTDGSDLRWDEPFPQNDDEWVDAIITGIRNIKEIDPSIKMICNEANAANEENYARVYAELDGIILENYLYLRFTSSYEPYDSERLARTFERLQEVNAEKVQIFQPRPASDDATQIRTAYVAYLIMSGPNSFFGALDEESHEINPANYRPIRAALGEPTEEPTYEEVTDESYGYRLYQREFEGGIAYLNWTGETQTIQLPSDTEYRDRDGNPIDELVLANKTGDYVIDPTAEVVPAPPNDTSWQLWLPFLSR